MTTGILSPSKSEIRFRLAGGAQPLILLPVQVNDRGPFDFILDTGAGTSLLSEDLAKRLGLKIISSREGQSAGGKVSVSLAKVESISVGGIKLQDLDVGIVDLSQIARTIGANIDGDLGYNFLKHFRVTIDYRASILRLDDPKRIESFARNAKTGVPIRLAHPAKPLILVDVHANGRGPFQFAIDTGTSTTAITPELAKELGVTTSPAGAGTTGGAAVAFHSGSLESFQLGGVRIDGVDVVVADFFTMLSAAVGAKLDGIVGYNFLRNYKVVIDYPGESLTLF
ncbi:MAG TPA: retroviral-like aspartic protease family protein [Chthoniobacterales bacterium]|nr:retroviral-like aspartic protease family protein [Chthoniobacterales bacterium]